MSDLARLKGAAQIGAEARGHRLGRWTDFNRGSRGLGSTAHCKDCRRYVTVLTRPDSNETSTSGTACGLNCREDK